MEVKNVHVIHSTSPINELRENLLKCGKVNYMCIIYKNFKKNGKSGRKYETNKTIVFCPEETIKAYKEKFPLVKDSVSDYDWTTFPVPSNKYNETWDLHVSGMPNNCTSKQANNVVDSLLSWLLKREEEGKTNYTTVFVPRSRQTGEIHGYGTITFSSHVDREIIKRCKLVLHNTFISRDNMITCTWQRKNVKSAKLWKKTIKPVFTTVEKVLDATELQNETIKRVEPRK